MSRIFYIYTEATVACMMLAAALIETLCGFVLPEPLGGFAFGAAVLFLLAAAHQVRYIINAEKGQA